MPDIKKVARDKLMRALGSHELVVAFENLTTGVGEDLPAQIAGLSISADAAQATADSAVAGLAGHVAAADPHPQYLSVSDAGTGFAPLVHTHAAADVTSGIFAVARLGSGTPSASTVLRGDGAWKPLAAYGQSTADQGPGFASDTYVTGSGVAIPAGQLKIGTRYRLVFDVSKTAAGTGTPSIQIRYGTAGSTADTSISTLTLLPQTAAADDGTIEVFCTFRVVGGSAVIQSVARMVHQQTTTGLATSALAISRVASAPFDSTPAGSILGLSIDAGAAAAWTVTLVQAELVNLA